MELELECDAGKWELNIRSNIMIESFLMKDETLKPDIATNSPTEICLEVPSTEYTRTGTKDEYSPKTGGKPASRANPMP